ncbi:AraC family transcriptional regulator [Paenibacillus sp. MER 99-2]|uniref:AraC family transcriptional regulator n=1 Tax=Paenibacillus sp. MER 99-2 TaxID=2939572 RepID=UPI00203C124D|nr:AraC family transcriptional regulator [Paenibacillus sp. MER 99-2]MCM3171396.1 AraC family transcriptional regulator [Paenibacillus sp. MER 99-2]
MVDKTEFHIDQNLKELTEHRTVSLPIACYETTIIHNVHGHIPLHWHDELQFVYVMQGKGLFRVNQEEIVVPKGNGIFINSGSMHMAEDIGERNVCKYICLNLSPQFILPAELYMKFVHPYVTATNVPYLLIRGDQSWGVKILEAIQVLKQNLRDQPLHYELDISAQLLTIWKQFISNGCLLEYDPNEMTRNLRMKGMLEWIHLHYAEPIKLEDIAKAGQLSRSETCRYFKQMLRTTPIHYVMDYRIRKSLELLQLPEMSITEIAYQVGFNSTSYYINQFGKIMNTTPLKFRREMVIKSRAEVNN